MNKLVDYTLIENEVLKESISDFLSVVRENMPGTFGSFDMKTVLHGEYAEVFFQLGTQVMIEGFTDDLVKVLGTHVLYAVRHNDGKTYKVVAYSVPVENKMYIIFLSSQQHGIVDSMTVYFYDSMDVMYKQMAKEYTNMPKDSVFVLEKEKFSEVVSNFY